MIIINNETSKNLKIQKGTRQGCPLSPLLFVMVLEILLRTVQHDNEISHKGFHYKYRAFADDVLFIAEDPKVTMLKLLNKITEFGKLAGFYINRQKSKIICKNMDKKQQKELEDLTQCENVKKVKYLGIQITGGNIDLFQNNYSRIWDKIETDLKKWRKLNLSLMGRIALCKMNVLPKILYLFQNIPIIKEMRKIEQWQKGLLKFIWQDKKPRVKFKVMCDVKERGGLQVPNLKIYFEAVCLAWIKEWITLDNKKNLKSRGVQL